VSKQCLFMFQCLIFTHDSPRGGTFLHKIEREALLRSRFPTSAVMGLPLRSTSRHYELLSDCTSTFHSSSTAIRMGDYR